MYEYVYICNIYILYTLINLLFKFMSYYHIIHTYVYPPPPLKTTIYKKKYGYILIILHQHCKKNIQNIYIYVEKKIFFIYILHIKVYIYINMYIYIYKYYKCVHI